MTDPRATPPYPTPPQSQAYAPPPAPAGYSYAPPYAMPRAPQPVPLDAPPTRTRTLGIVAFVASLVAGVVAPFLAAVAALQIGRGVASEFLRAPGAMSFDWSALTPVRDWVLWGEISFYLGTAFGIWALAQGIVALMRKRGAGFAIAAVVIAAIGPVLWLVALQIGLTLATVGAVAV